MAGRCFGCSVEFGFFKREYGCGKCGRIFCSKCLPNSAIVANRGTKAVKVCNVCYEQLTSKKLHPDGEKLTTDSSKLQNSFTTSSSTSSGKVTGSKVAHDPNEDIQRRLTKLKQRDEISNDTDIVKRFENLTGRTPMSETTSNINTFGPKKTEVEQVSNLLTQMQDECNLDERTGYQEDSDNGFEDIERRLDKLKGRESSKLGSSNVKQTYDYDSDDETEFRKKYIQRAIEESFLDDKVRQQGYGDFLDKAEQKIATKNCDPIVDPDELPWCCICNEDAKLQCHDCDDDLYCKRCFREGHDSGEYKRHRTSPYKPPKT